MPSPIDAGAAAKQAEQFGFPAGFKAASAFPFGGMNRSDSRLAIEDKEFSWLENYIRIGKGKMRTAWDIGPALYTAPPGRTIVSFYWFNIAAGSFCAVFLSDGTVVQVAWPSGAVTVIGSTPGQFYQVGSPLPACCPWGAQYLLISNNLTANSYWVWDGTLLYSSGGIAPVTTLTSGGSGYSSAPTVTAFGGSGSGATFTATVINGSVVSVVPLTTGTGYGPADQVQLRFSGGGSDNGAVLQAVLVAGTVSSILLTNGGSAYTSVPTVALTGGGGSGATAVAVLTGTTVTGVTVTNPGTGYTGTPAVAFSGGGGSGAQAVATLSAGAVDTITVIDGGTNFTGTPTLLITGGGGIGALATAVVTAGVITSVAVTNGGTDYNSEPTVTVQSGLNNAASGSATLMPIGISGAAIETFQSRAWLAHPFQAGTLPAGGSINITGPGSPIDFATSDGGLLFQNSDRFLRAQYTALRQSNGYLYTLGDSSVGVISNVQTAGNPPTTSFNALNVDPQTGSSWRDTCQDYGRTILFANPFGVFGIYGGAITKVSKKLDPLFDEAVFPPAVGALTPSGAVATLFAQRFYLLLLTLTDPLTGLPRNALLGWDEADWGVFSQSAALTYIGTQETNSDPVAWGTDGAGLMPLFAAPSASLVKTLQTKYFAADSSFMVEASYAIYVTAQNKHAGSTSLTFTSTTTDSIGTAMPSDIPQWMKEDVPFQGGSYENANPVAFSLPASGAPATFGTGCDPVVAGSGLGLTMITFAPDYELVNLQLGYIDVHAIA
jgi:hypothetical protein